MQKVLLFKILCLVILVSVLTGCGSSVPIIIKPSLQEFNTPVSPASAGKYYVKQVIDKRGVADSTNIGFTQTGMWNVQTALLSSPPPTTLLQNTTMLALQKCNVLSSDSSTADFIVAIDLSQFQLTEITGMFSENIEAKVQYDAAIIDRTTGKRVKRISAKGTYKKGGMDTTAFAEEVARKALEIALQSFIQELLTTK